jgi:hypothetical protein
MSDFWYELDRQGNVLLVHKQKDKPMQVTDLAGQVSRELKGEYLDRYELQQMVVPWARTDLLPTRSYRNRNRFMIEYTSRSKPSNEGWWYVPEQGRVLGYDKQTNLPIGSFGPRGFARPDQPAQDRFEGELAYFSLFYLSRAAPYLAFPTAAYTVDFRALTVRPLFVPRAPETVLWASRWEDESLKLSRVFVGTDTSIQVLDEAGSAVLSISREYDRKTYCITKVGRLENPERYWVWYEPAWYLGLESLETMPVHLVIYSRADGRVCSRQDVPPRPGGVRGVRPPQPIVEPTRTLAWLGLVTSPAEFAVLVGSMRGVESDVRRNDGSEVPLLLGFLYVTTQYFIPGIRWDLAAHSNLVLGYGTLMLLSAILCGLVCFLLGRRFAFARATSLGWALVGLLFGPFGLLLMLALQEWPAKVTCPGCRKFRVVTRQTCEHCGVPQAVPAPDGTEIFEDTSTTLEAALTSG